MTLTVISELHDNEDVYVVTCDAGSKPQVTLIWTLGGTTQTDGNGNTIVETNPTVARTSPVSNTRSVFTFPATQENYGQTLVCQTTGHQLTELNRQESIDLNIHTSPSTARTTVTADYVTEGTDNIRVTCTAQNETTPIMRNYYIFSNGVLIHESMDSVNEYTARKTSVRTEITCMAGNYLGNTSLSAAVTYEPPTRTNGQLVTMVTVTGTSPAVSGTDVTLTCDITGGTPPLILWVDDSTTPSSILFAGTTRVSVDEKFDNFEVTSSTSTQSILTISSAEVRDGGIYRCVIPGTDGSKHFVVEEDVPPLINLTVIAITHEDPTVDALAQDAEIRAFVADPSAQYGTMEVASAFTGPDGIATLMVPHNQSLIVTAFYDGTLANSITTKANPKLKNVVTIPVAAFEELNLFRWLRFSSNVFSFGGQEGSSMYQVSILPGSLSVRRRGLVQIEFYGVNLTIPEQYEHAPEAIGVLNMGRAELVDLEVLGMMELNVFATTSPSVPALFSDYVTITIPVTSPSNDISVGDSVDAWYFNQNHGVWVNDGSGIIRRDPGSGQLVWEYEARHFTWWAAATVQTQTSCVKVKTCLDDACNLPLPGVRIQLTGKDYAFSSSRTTDRHAEALFNVKRGRTVTLEAVCAREKMTVAITSIVGAFDHADADIPAVELDPLLPCLPSDVCREITMTIPLESSNITCRDPGEVEFSTRNLRGRTYSDAVQYTCDMGRFAREGSYRTCLECGVWSGRPIECTN
ncbi:uncharacterized protein LOC121430984 [Lytechinus variegatus]|uniref:uncharacterized protein LOC121430984 n=1 Tax=Lytechinus variegatus TaxID=7654 RepID=UPI001BB200EC|nr:uncharacterized protein LOC121430984 [Lytechinus variegatus]